MNSFVDQKDYLRFCKNSKHSMSRSRQDRKETSNILNNNNSKNRMNSKNGKNGKNGKNSKYIPPSKRQIKRIDREKTFDNNIKNFPLLNSSSKQKENSNINNSSKTNMDFVSLFNKKKSKKSDVKRGWVKLSRVNNKTVFKEGGSTNKYRIRNMKNIDENKNQNVIIKETFNNLIERWQNERDEMNEVMEQWSPYWNIKDLREPLSDNEYETSENDEDYENEFTENDVYNEYYSDDDFY
tara:strand:+ start:4894 stop:5610 length:717 start_codon:yes stop_codon:yes gene_type:complete